MFLFKILTSIISCEWFLAPRITQYTFHDIKIIYHSSNKKDKNGNVLALERKVPLSEIKPYQREYVSSQYALSEKFGKTAESHLVLPKDEALWLISLLGLLTCTVVCDSENSARDNDTSSLRTGSVLQTYK